MPRFRLYLTLNVSSRNECFTYAVFKVQSLTDVLSAIRRYNSLYPLITGKTSYPNSVSPLMWVTPFLVPFYLIAFSPALFWGSRQPPAFPCRLQHSIIGRFSLNRRVRDGYGCFPEAHRHRKDSLSTFSLITQQ